MVSAGAGASGQGGQGGALTAGAGGGAIAGAGGSAGASGKAGGVATPDPCALWDRPEGSELDDKLPELALQRLEGDSEESLSLHSLRSSCERPGLLVVRVEPAWCAPCGKRADQLGELLKGFPAEQLDVVTVLYAGPDNAHPTASDLRLWRQAHPSLPGQLARSPDGMAASLIRRAKVVPMVLLVDRRTLRIASAQDILSEDYLVEKVSSSLQEVGVVDATVVPEEKPLIDARFDAFEWSLVQDMTTPLVLPPSPSNAHADDTAAAALGALWFEDGQLAAPTNVACATCHRKDKGFGDGLPVAQGVSVGSLNTPSIDTAAWNRWFFWNGRADSLWSQALGPLENPLETGGNRLHVAHRIKEAYSTSYEAVFGPLPPLDDLARFPPEGRPGDAVYDAMSEADREAVTRVFVNTGKAIEAFERTLRPPPTRLEAYAAGDFEALTPLERDGLRGFLINGCVSCHHGPTLSDGAFHNILMPSSSPSGPGDRGRVDGVATLLASPFRSDGPYSDAPEAGGLLKTLTVGEEMLGQMKTPSLRGVSRSGPWGHGGTFASLEEVAKHYGQAKPQELQGPRFIGERDPAIAGFLGGHNTELIAFLKVFGGD